MQLSAAAASVQPTAAHTRGARKHLQASPQGSDVRLEDQQKINTFSRLNTRLHELEAQLAAKKVRCCLGACEHAPLSFCWYDLSQRTWHALHACVACQRCMPALHA